MLKRIAAVVLFFALFIGGFIYLQYSKMKVNAAPAISSVKGAKEKTGENSYGDEGEKQQEPIDTRLTFKKKLTFVYIGEMNNGALKQEVPGDLNKEDTTFNQDTKAIYFYNQQLIPTENDNLLIIDDIYNLDTLLEQIVLKSDLEVNFSFPHVDNEYVNNEGRLFLDKNLHITTLNGQRDIQIKLDGQEKILKPGESWVATKQNGKSFSKVVITNYGQWDTQNIKYAVMDL